MTTQLVHKVTLSTGKVIFLKEMTQGIEEKAIKSASFKTDASNQMLVGYHTLDEVCKLLVAGVEKNKKQTRLTGNELELFFKNMTYSETKQLRRVVGKLMGEEEGQEEATMEIVTGGN